MAFLFLGDVIAGAIYQTGQFTRRDSVYVWGILAGSAVGLLATTLGRLYASMYYALKDTRTPLRFGILRIFLTMVLGYLCALPLPPALGLDRAGEPLGSLPRRGSADGWSYVLLRNSMDRSWQNRPTSSVTLETMGLRRNCCSRWLANW